MAAVIFFIAALLAIAGAFGVVVLRNPFYNVLALVVHLLALAALFLLLRAEFVAAAQVVVYAGAVMVLYIFVVAYVGGTEEEVTLTYGSGARGLKVLAALFCGALLVELFIAVLGSGLSAIDSRGAGMTGTSGYGSPGAIGEALLTKFLFPFEAASILLLVAAVGAVILARRRRGLDLDEVPGPDSSHGQLRRPAWSGTMLEGAGGAMERDPVPAAGAAAPGGAEHGGRRDGAEGGW